MANEAFPGKQNMEACLAQFRAAADIVRDNVGALEARVQASMIGPADEEICYAELWMRQIREALDEIDGKIGHVRAMNWKRALHNWFQREDLVRLYGHTFRLEFHMIPSLPKARTKERGELIEWLKAGQRMDCLVMDEASGDWVFDFKKMETLVNEMLSAGNRPPDSIKLHPQPKIIVRVAK